MTVERKSILPLVKTMIFSLVATALVVLPLGVTKTLYSDLFFRVGIQVISKLEQPVAQFFFDIGNDFNENDSESKPIERGSDIQTLRFRLPIKNFGKLRFDPINGSGTILLKNPSIVTRESKTIYSFDLNQIASANDIAEMKELKAGFSIQTTPNASDPQIIFTLDDSFDSHWNKWFIRQIFTSHLGSFFMYFGPVFIAFFLARHDTPLNLRPDSNRIEMHEQTRSQKKNIAILIFVSIGIFILILFLRSWDNLVNPGFYAEDSVHYFNRYYPGNRPFEFVLQRPHGYYNIMNNTVAWIASKFDVRQQAHVYQIFSITSSIITSVCLLFSNLFLTPVIILILPSVLGLSGMNNIYYYVTLTFQMYVAIVLLLCLMFIRAPKNRLGLVMAGLVYLLLIWSGPFSVIAVPVAYMFLALFNEKRKSGLMVWIILCTLVYTSTVQGMVKLSNLFDSTIVLKMISILVEKVFFLDLFDHVKTPMVFVMFIAVLLCVFYLRHEPKYMRYTLIFWCIVLLGPTPLFLSLKFEQYPFPKPCHVFISQFFWLTWLLYTSETLIRKRPKNKFLYVLIPSLFIFFMVTDNIRHTDKRYIKPMIGIQDFLRAVSDAEKLGLEDTDRYVILSFSNVNNPHFRPTVRVGSRKRGAEKICGENISIESIKRFIVD